MNDPKNLKLSSALIPIVALMVMLTVNVVFYFDNALSGPNQIALFLAAAVSYILALRNNKGHAFILKSILNRVKTSLVPICILLMIGALAASWLISGVIPAIVYYGIGAIKPKIFLFTTVVVCSVVSLATGSSWSTVATIGIALNGIGQVLGISSGLVAGAIISGAYFGDKISPLSDTTNLASAVTGTNLFVHIRYMLLTTVPAILLTMLIFLLIGYWTPLVAIGDSVLNIKGEISSQFNISPYLFIVPIVLIILIMARVPALISLFVGVVLGCVFAVIFQKDLLLNYTENSIGFIFKTSFMGFEITEEKGQLAGLFSASGVLGMKNTALLILSAMVFSGAAEAAGVLSAIARAIMRFAKNTSSLIASTIATSIFFNLTASDQYIAIVVPGRIFSDLYKKHNLKSEVLSRTLEDSGTQTSVLVPWNTCGATQSSVLGVSVMSYLPYCFFNILSPVFSMLWAVFKFKIRYAKKEK